MAGVFAAGSALSAAPKGERAASPGDYLSYSGFAVPATPVLPPHEVHPSLWFRATDRERLVQLKAADGFSRERWAAVVRLADLNSVLPPAPPTPVPIDRLDESIHRYYGRMSMMARASALAGFLETDPVLQQRYLARSRELLLRAYDGPIFLLDSRVTSSPVDEIYRGTWLQDYVDAYDTLQGELTPADDREIRRRLSLEAECIYENLYRWTPTSPHNHLSKPAWGLGSAALALSDDPRAKAWLARALEAANRNTRYFFAADGNYREGSHYSIFSLTNYVPFLYNYRNVSGVDDFPVFQPAFEYMVEVRNSRGWMPNIGDSYLKPTPTHLVAAAYRTARTKLSRAAPLSEILQWSYASASLAPFESDSKQNGVNYTGATLDYPLPIDEFLTHDPSIVATPPDCPASVFLESGESVFRTDWTRVGPGERYLLFHAVASADNHGHPDHLSFILEAEGQMMASDAGYARGNYHDTSRLGWYATAAAHNVLTVDGEAAVDEAPNRTPASLFRAALPSLVLERKETVFPHGARWQRTIAMIANDFFVVFDQVQSPAPARLAGYLHGGRGQLTGSESRWTWTFGHDAYGAPACLDVWLSAGAATVERKMGEITYIKGDYQASPYLQLAQDGRSLAWVTLLKPRGVAPASDFLVEPSSTGFTVRSGGRVVSILAQRGGGATIRAGDVATDAAMAIVQRDLSGRVLSYGLIDGSRLSLGDQMAWRSPAPTSSAAEPGPLPTDR